MTTYRKSTILCYKCQSGYLRNSSNITLLFKMKDGIDKAMKCGENKLSVFVDFSKAFGTIDFNILI